MENDDYHFDLERERVDDGDDGEDDENDAFAADDPPEQLEVENHPRVVRRSEINGAQGIVPLDDVFLIGIDEDDIRLRRVPSALESWVRSKANQLDRDEDDEKPTGSELAAVREQGRSR